MKTPWPGLCANRNQDQEAKGWDRLEAPLGAFTHATSTIAINGGV